MPSPDWPDWMRRIQASCEVSNSPSPAGKVRVDSWPSWWQPMQPMFLTCFSQSVCLKFSEISLPSPNASSPGISSMAYQ
jgi:hypothetical protein